MPDTPENVTTFGRPASPDGTGAGYPQVRLVALLSLRHHLLAAAAVGASRTGELALARKVWDALPDHAVVILDRGFCSYALFHALSDPIRDRHWLVRARDGRPPCSARSSSASRRAMSWWSCNRPASPAPSTPTSRPRSGCAPSGSSAAASAPTGSSPRCCNPATPPAADLAALYHDRWELELAFDELKTHTLDRAEALRSKAPARVEQEVWGLLLAYNLVRLVMSRAAPRAGVPPVTLELSPRAPRPARLLAHRVAHATRRLPAASRRCSTTSRSSCSPSGAPAATRAL